MLDLNFVPLRVLVTGARGKSSLVRLLHAAFSACGLKTYARITGVVPRELAPEGVRVVRRTSPAHVREMRWWLLQIPSIAQAVVMENSAVAPELQEAAGAWLNPVFVVWTTLRADHREAWGPGIEGAANALVRGVPPGVPVVGGPELSRPEVFELLRARGCKILTTSPFKNSSHDEENQALALKVCELCAELGFFPADVLAEAGHAVRALAPDVADFRVLKKGNDELAAAFSANDVESTALLFAETGWSPEETTLLFHHRPDRPARLEDFLAWIYKLKCKATVFTRTKRPLLRLPFWGSALNWHDEITDAASFEAWFSGQGRVFACGNVAGWPLEVLSLREDEL